MKTHLNIQPKSRTYKGKVFEWKNDVGSVYNAVTKKDSVRIYGVESNHVNGPFKFDRTYKIGDTVQYDSYNLIYLGQIEKIGPSTVTVKTDLRDMVRMNLFDFTRKNLKLDLEAVNKYNDEESQCI